MNVLDLFSGIGGFSLGLERAGMRTVAFCEIDPYARAVLAARWPGIPIYGDVRELTSERLAADGIEPEVICGGFPCQDISRCNPGERAGLAGEHSGLWSEFSRLIRALRPRFVIVENVPELCVRGFERVLGDLADVGYDAEWEGVPAAAVGAPHLRARQWILAYPGSVGDRLPPEGVLARGLGLEHRDWWASEPAVRRVDDGIPGRVDRLRVLGNAVIPQIAEAIGRAIVSLPPLQRRSVP